MAKKVGSYFAKQRIIQLSLQKMVLFGQISHIFGLHESQRIEHPEADNLGHRTQVPEVYTLSRQPGSGRLSN